MQELLLDGDLPEESQRDFLQRMSRETERIHAVVRDFLDFARPEGRGMSSPPSAGMHAAGADVASVARDVLSLVGAQRAYRGMQIDADVGAGLRVALAGPRLTQVLLNTVLNAAAAIAGAGRDGGRITIRGRPLEGGRVRIDVEDRSRGRTGHAGPALRAVCHDQGRGEGTGLGLAVCRGIVESAGGEIGLDASYAGGARFSVILPG